MNRLDALSRNELRALCRELVALLGEDAVARLVPDAPFSPAGDAPQLALTAVDPATTLRDLSDAFAMHLGLVRAHASEVPGVAEALDADAMSAALKGSLTRIASAAARALAFDPAAGLKLAGAIVATVRRAERANQAYASAGAGAWSREDAVEGLRPLLDALPLAAPGVPFDDEALETWVRLADDISAIAPGVDAWSWLGAALDRAPDVRVAAAARWSETRTWDAHQLPLLLTLAQRTSPATIEPFLRAVDMHSTRNADVVDLVIETLRRVGRRDEALFWEGERERRFGT